MIDNRLEERGINLIKLFRKALVQWRLIVIIIVLFSLILPLGIGFKNGCSASNGVATTIKTEKELELEYNSIQATLSTYMQYRTLDSAYNSSVLNNVDFSKATSVTSTYELKVLDESQRVVTLSNAYIAISSDSDFTEAIGSVYSEDAVASSIYDICKINVLTSNTESNSDTAILQVKTYLPSGVSDSEWSDVLTTALEKYSESIKDSVGSHQVTLVSVNSVGITADKISTILNDKITEITTARTAYNVAYNNLSTDNKDIVDSIISKNEDKNYLVFNLSVVQDDLDEIWEDSNTAVASGRSESGTAFSVKWIMIGALIGLFIYCMIILAQEVFGKCITSDDQLRDIFKTRHFGSVFEYPYITILGRIFNDRKLYNRFNKSVEVDKMATDLATKLTFMDISEVEIITLSDVSDKLSVATVNKIKNTLENKGVSVKMLFVSKSVSDMNDEEFLNCNKVFVQVVSGQTTYADARDLVCKAAEYNIDIIGTDFIEISI